MADVLKEFLVSIGFAADSASQSKAEAAVNATEAKITAAAAQQADKRTEIEQKASDARLTIAEALSRLLANEEQKLADSREKARKGEADKDERRQHDAAKKAQERREAALKAMQANVLKMTAFATKAVLGIESLSLAGVAYAVTKAAESFDRMNFMGQRVGSAPASITAFGYAASQLGSSADEANSSLENFGKNLRTNPNGYAQALERLGVRARDANGHLRDSADIATDLGDALRNIRERGGQYGYTNAVNEAALFGFNENQARAMMDPRYRQYEDQRRAQQREIGADPNEAGPAGTAFMQSLRRFRSSLEDVATRVETVLTERLRPQLDALADWAAKNGGKIAEFVTTLANGVIDLATAFAKSTLVQDAVKGLASGLEDLAKYVSSDDFKRDVRSFVADIKSMAHTLRSVLEWLGIIPSHDATASSPTGGTEHNYDPGLVQFMHAAYRGRSMSVPLPQATRDRANRELKDFDAGLIKPTGADDPLKRFIAAHEGGGYNVVYGHNERGGPNAPPKPITEMTIGEVLTYQHEMRAKNGTPAWPVGRGQWVESTLRRLTAGMDPNTKLTPEVQEHLFDRSIAGRLNQGPYGFRQEWDSLRGVSDADIAAAIQAHRDYKPTPAKVAAVATGARSDGPPVLADYMNSDGTISDAKAAQYNQDRQAYAARQSTPAASSLPHPQSHPLARPLEHPHSTPVKVELTDNSAAKIAGNASLAVRRDAAFHQHSRHAERLFDRDQAEAKYRAGLDPARQKLFDAMKQLDAAQLKLHAVSPLGITPSVQQQINNGRRGNTNIQHSQNFTIHSGDVKSAMAAARMQADRGQRDLLRNLQGMEA